MDWKGMRESKNVEILAREPESRKRSVPQAQATSSRVRTDKLQDYFDALRNQPYLKNNKLQSK